MRKVGFVYDDIYLQHENPQGHPESADRLDAIMNQMKSSDIWDELVALAPRRATEKELLSVHTPEHIKNISTQVGYADPDTYISEGSHTSALYAAGASLVAIDKCKSGEIERAFCAVRPPGHHAEADRAMGFCLYNNIAVAARYAQSIGYEKVFIIDFDVHHGNGTQNMFYNDSSVFYFSTHQWPHYPGTGTEDEKGGGDGVGANANLHMGNGCGDKEYHMIYNDVLPNIVKDFNPDIVLVSAGYDMHAQDPLSGIGVTRQGVESIVGGILSSADTPFVFSLEGGYDLSALAQSVEVTVGKLLSQ